MPDAPMPTTSTTSRAADRFASSGPAPLHSAGANQEETSWTIVSHRCSYTLE